MLQEAAEVEAKEREDEAARARLRSSEQDVDQELRLLRLFLSLSALSSHDAYVRRVFSEWVANVKSRTQAALERTRLLQQQREVLSLSCFFFIVNDLMQTICTQQRRQQMAKIDVNMTTQDAEMKGSEEEEEEGEGGDPLADLLDWR